MSPLSGNLRLVSLVGALAILTACGTSAPKPERARSDDSARAVSQGDGAVSDLAGDAVSPIPVEVPERALALHARALAAMESGDWLAAQLELEQLIAEFPAFPGPYVNLAIALRQEARVTEAESALAQALAIAPDHPAANNELGMLARKRGEFAEAEAAYRRAIASDPGYSLAHYNLGVLLDLYLRRESEALEQYEAYQALVPSPDEEVDRWVVDLRRRLGMSDETARVAQEVGP